MNVKLAARHRQPRTNKPEACDHHSGLALEADPTAKPVFCAGVRLYNIFLPSIGTESFHLCDEAAEELRRD